MSVNALSRLWQRWFHRLRGLDSTSRHLAVGSFSQECIQIKGLRVDCIVGVLPHERRQDQPLLIDIRAASDFSQAAASDDLHHTVDYAAVAEEVQRFVRQGRFHLLETLVRQLAPHLCAQFNLSGLQLQVRKPQAIAQAQEAAVSLCYGAWKPKGGLS